MTGILPNNGVSPGQTQNGLDSAILAPGCENLYYGPRCNPRMDPFAMNALISELINAVNATGAAYDCTKLTNLAEAIAASSRTHTIAVARTAGIADRTLPVQTPPTNSVNIGQGSFNIPNTSTETIRCLLVQNQHAFIADNSIASMETIFFGLRTFLDAAHTQPIALTHIVSTGGGGGTVASYDYTPSASAFIDVPPGGMTVYWYFDGAASEAGVLAQDIAGSFSIYGVSGTAGSTIDL